MDRKWNTRQGHGRGKNSRVSTWHRAAAMLSAAVAGLGLMGRSQVAHAATTTDQWDPGQTTPTATGGAGSWDTVTPNWLLSGATTTWINGTSGAGGGNNAVFGGNGDAATGGTVTIDSNITNIVAGNLTFNNSGYNVTAVNYGSLYLTGTSATTASLITTNANATISAPIFAATTNGAAFAGASTLTLGSGAAQGFIGNFNVSNGANVALAAGNNTLGTNIYASGSPGVQLLLSLDNLTLNGTFNLNGNNQVLGQFNGTSTSAVLNNSSTNASTVIFSNNSTTVQSFAGSITGNINLEFAGNSGINPVLPFGKTTLSNANSYTGTTTFSNGTVDLGGTAGQLTGTSAVIGYGGTLLIDNSTADLVNRLNTAASVTLNNSTLTLQGFAGSTSSAQTLGTVTANSGTNIISVQAGASSGVATLTIGNLQHTTGGVLTFTGNNLGGTTVGGATGTSVALINNLNGNAFGTNSLTNNIIGGYAVVQTGSNVAFASYIAPTTGVPGGVIALGNSNAPGYNAAINSYSTNSTATALSTDNITTSAATFTSSKTIWSLTATNTISIPVGNTLTVGSGGIIQIWGGSAPGFGANVGSMVTAGTSSNAAELNYFGVNPGSVASERGPAIWSSTITDNTSGGSVSFVYNANTAFAMSETGNPNTYSGSTIVNGNATGGANVAGELIFNSTLVSGTNAMIPHALIINGGTVAFAQSNQTSSNNTSITINAGALDMTGASITNTITGLTINNNGGPANPFLPSTADGSAAVLSAGAGNTLVLNGNLTVVNNNFVKTPVFNTNTPPTNDLTLDLGGANRTFNISGASPFGLNLLNTFVNDGGIIKTGTGIMEFAPATGSTFSYLDVQQGALDYTANSPAFLPTNNSVDAGGAVYTSYNSGYVQGTLNLNGGKVGALSNGGVGFASVNVTTNGGTAIVYNPINPAYSEYFIITTLTGSGTLNVVGPTVANFQGDNGNGPSLLLNDNSANTFNGPISISSNATLFSEPANPGFYGNTFGTNTITMSSNATLKIQDNGSAGGLSNSVLSGYNNSLIINGLSTLTIFPQGVSETGNILPINNVTLNNNSTFNVNTQALYVVRMGGTLSGGGTLAGTGYISVTGTVAPGDQPAILNVNNTDSLGGTNVTTSGFSLAGSSTYAPEINRTLGAGWQGSNATNAGISYDQINMLTGYGLIINAGATLNVRMSGTSSLAAGDKFFLVNETVASTGSFNATVDFNGTPETSIGVGPDGGLEYNDPTNSSIVYELDYTGNITTGSLTTGRDIVLDVITGAPVPEPASLSLIGIGAMGLLARRRRQQKSK